MCHASHPRVAHVYFCSSALHLATRRRVKLYTLYTAHALRALRLVRLAYGARGRPPQIPGHSVLIFTNTIEIKRITGNKKPKAAAVEL